METKEKAEDIRAYNVGDSDYAKHSFVSVVSS